MPTVDVVIVGAGLAGLSAALELAEAGASVFVAGHGHAATHWAHGGLDVAAPDGVETSRQGVAALSAVAGHPYGLLADDVEPGLRTQLARLTAAGLPYRGSLDDPLSAIPTAIGGVRRAAILPRGQAAAVGPWAAGERLLIIGFDGFKDFWAPFMADNLERSWRGDARPEAIGARVVELPRLGQRRNLGALEMARWFDADLAWRDAALAALASAAPTSGRWRVALPAALGLERHEEVRAAVEAAIGHPVFEVPSVPPSVPGLRLAHALTDRASDLGVRVQVGFPVVRVERHGRRIDAVHTEGAARTYRIAAGRVVLATGGIAGGGIRAEPDGTLREIVLDLPVDGPARRDWFSGGFDSGGDPLEAAGIRVDGQLRPLDPGGRPALDNVHVIGSLLAGMRFLGERCGDGVAIASARRVAASLGAGNGGADQAPLASAAGGSGR